MKFAPVTILVIGLSLALCAGVATANRAFEDEDSLRGGGTRRATAVKSPAEAYYDALYESGDGPDGQRASDRDEPVWFYEVDFDSGEEGWIGYDRSWVIGYPKPQENYWHRDTVRMHPIDPLYDHLDDGDGVPYSWWCGTTNDCWPQPRGYSNDWVNYLQRGFWATDLPTATGELYLEFDQRFAMDTRGGGDYGFFGVWNEADGWNYDFGWGDEGTGADPKWVAHNSEGFGGYPTDWLDYPSSHVELQLNDYANQLIHIRFKFESSATHSCADYPVNLRKSAEDGAWQIDNIKFYDGPSSNPERVELWADNCETGDNGWLTNDIEPPSPAGASFARGQLGDPPFVTGAGYSCDAPPSGSGVWWSCWPGPQMQDYTWTWLVSPPIDISGVPEGASLVAEWNMFIDFPANTNDSFSLSLASCDSPDVNKDLSLFVDEQPGWWYGGPSWGTWTDNWDAFAGNDWLAIMWQVGNSSPPIYPAEHGTGMFLNWMKVGYVEGDGGGVAFERDPWNTFHDWDREDPVGPELDVERIRVTSDIPDTDIEVLLRGHGVGGGGWSGYYCTRESPGSDWWKANAPSYEIYQASINGGEIQYYYEVTDLGVPVATYPDGAPGTGEPGEAKYFEFSLLPIDNPETGEPPDALLVDKHGRRTPGEGRDYAHTSEYYYREAMEIMGYVDELGNPLYDVYDVEVPSATTDQSDGPPLALLESYDTVIWFTSDTPTAGLKPYDATNLMAWLDEASEINPRSLWLTGNNVNTELYSGDEIQQTFLSDYLFTDVWGSSVVSLNPPDGDGHPNLQPGLHDVVGGEVEFMTYDDGECILAGDCPLLPEFDIVIGLGSQEVVANYNVYNGEIWVHRPAGVALHTEADPPVGADWYTVLNLGFGLEFMMDSVVEGGGRTDYTYVSGINDRVSVVENIVAEYFGVLPDTSVATGIEAEERRNELSQAYPNPFNPVTKIAYSVKDAGRVTIRIYNVAGRAVRTLLDAEMAAGATGHVVWDGFDDASQRCGTGVYFYRIEAPGFATSKKMIMMK